MNVRHRNNVLVLASTVAAACAVPSAAAQSAVRGVVYDSLLGAPLAGAEVWLRGTEQRTQTGDDGQFRFSAVPAGRYVLTVLHAGLDSAGLYTAAIALTVAAGDTAVPPVTVATPSLATLWRRRCGTELGTAADSGLVFGVIQDAATGTRLAGAAVIASWAELAQRTSVSAEMRPRGVVARTDSIGSYYACGVATDMTLALRGYAGTDSTGLIDLRLGARRVGRQDLTIGLAPAAGAAGARPRAALRGTATTNDGRPLASGRVSVRDTASATISASGTFLLTGLPPGTQWVSVQAIGRTPVEQAVDLRGGDTAFIAVRLEPLPVTLAPVRITGQRAQLMAEFDERRRMGLGYTITEADLAGVSTMRAALGGVPSARLQRGRGSNADFEVLLPSPGLQGGRAFCVATLFIDGFRSNYEQLSAYQPSELLGIEVYARASSAPLKYQSVASGCGVVLVWTKLIQ